MGYFEPELEASVHNLQAAPLAPLRVTISLTSPSRWGSFDTDLISQPEFIQNLL